MSQLTRQRLSGSISPPSGWKTRLRICTQTHQKHITTPLCQKKSIKPSRGPENLWRLRDDSNRMLSCTVTCSAVLKCCSYAKAYICCSKVATELKTKRRKKRDHAQPNPAKRDRTCAHKPSNHEHNDWPCKVIPRGEPIFTIYCTGCGKRACLEKKL